MMKIVIYLMYNTCSLCQVKMNKVSGGLMDKVSASQTQDCGIKPYTGNNHDSSNYTSTGWFQMESDLN